MKQKYVIDSTALISYFSQIFEKEIVISNSAIEIIDNAFRDEDIILHYPSIVFLEIFSKHFISEDRAQLIKYEVFERIMNQSNMSIEPIDLEVLEAFLKIRDIEQNYNFDNHDKQVFATAMKFNCPLITSDERLIRYNNRMHLIPDVIN
jgi:predicted nucleic acid-binding protein